MAGRSSRGFGKLSEGRQAPIGRQIAFRILFGFLMESECLLKAFWIPVGFFLNSGCLRKPTSFLYGFCELSGFQRLSGFSLDSTCNRRLLVVVRKPRVEDA